VYTCVQLDASRYVTMCIADNGRRQASSSVLAYVDIHSRRQVTVDGTEARAHVRLPSATEEAGREGKGGRESVIRINNDTDKIAERRFGSFTPGLSGTLVSGHFAPCIRNPLK